MASNNRDQLRKAYWEYLGRGAEDSEIDNWMSGKYGGGGIDDWLNAIQNSGEAKHYTSNVQKLQAAYSRYLGRPASDEDIDGWVSGGYGGGGIDDWLNQIQNSGEAQRHAKGPPPAPSPRPAPTPPPPPPTTTPPVPSTKVATIHTGETGSAEDEYDPVMGNIVPPVQTPPTAAIEPAGKAVASNNDRAAIRQAYRDYLGRDASEDEIEGWVSGGYGGSGINDWLNQIQNSGEAKDYAARAKGNDQGGTNTSPPTGETGGAEDESDPDIPKSGPPPEDPSTPNTEVIDHDYEDAVEQLRAAYRTHIGREASNDEIQGWWSGNYGWGQKGFGGLEGWLRGIKTEGDRLKGLNTGTNNKGTGVPARKGRAPHGWDQAKWADPDHHTTKYDVAAFLYDVTEPSEVKRIVESAAFQERFPGATFNGKDKIDFGDNLEDGVPVGIIDVLMQANEGQNTSAGLWWGDTGNDPAPGSDGTQTRVPGGPIEGVNEQGENKQDGTEDGTDIWKGYPPNSPLAPPQLSPGPNTYGMMGQGGGGGTMGQGGGGGTMGQMITPYNPLETYSPTPYTPPAPFRPPTYQGATPFQQEDYTAATPFQQDPYTGATPFEQADYTAATPFQQDAYQAATPFGQDPYEAAAPFEGPTAEDMAADPSYQFRLQQGQEALERSSAALGVTNTGGTLKDILDYGQKAASQEYGSIFGRQRDMYDMNERNRFNAYQSNYGNALQAYGMNEANRAGAFDTNAANRYRTYAMNEANRAGAFDVNAANQFQAYGANEANRFNAYQANYGNALGAYGMNEANRAGAFNVNAANQYRAYTTNEANRAGAFDRNVGNARDAYTMNEENRYRGYTTNEIARLQQNQEAENRRSGAYNTNLGAYQNQQQYGLRAQGQGYDQQYRNWVQQWNQQRGNRRDNFDMMRGLATR